MVFEVDIVAAFVVGAGAGVLRRLGRGRHLGRLEVGIGVEARSRFSERLQRGRRLHMWRFS